ncbi:hypothetical protein SAMN04489713_102637 [Actinomadura madurae]|uniref:Uncharacterized protein n=1 Tax=Actinomadura madurae TaxID=1993 RepID=A0A1I5AL14_9ACTN|nr:hypothetical protein SAMN04489713_102637 [Actinomadura madurae]
MLVFSVCWVPFSWAGSRARARLSMRDGWPGEPGLSAGRVYWRSGEAGLSPVSVRVSVRCSWDWLAGCPRSPDVPVSGLFSAGVPLPSERGSSSRRPCDPASPVSEAPLSLPRSPWSWPVLPVSVCSGASVSLPPLSLCDDSVVSSSRWSAGWAPLSFTSVCCVPLSCWAASRARARLSMREGWPGKPGLSAGRLFCCRSDAAGLSAVSVRVSVPAVWSTPTLAALPLGGDGPLGQGNARTARRAWALTRGADVAVTPSPYVIAHVRTLHVPTLGFRHPPCVSRRILAIAPLLRPGLDTLDWQSTACSTMIQAI